MDTYHLLPDDEIDRTLERLYEISPVTKGISTKSSHTYFDAYQVNCSYFSALDEDENVYLLARAIQFLHLAFRWSIIWACWQALMIWSC